VVALDPIFECRVVEEEEEHEIEIDCDGTTARRREEHDATIPQIIDYPVKTAANSASRLAPSPTSSAEDSRARTGP
jgi:hypothetical protein